MTTDADIDLQAAHRAKFAQVVKNLKLVADNLVSQYPDFPKRDFGRCFLTAAIALLIEDTGAISTGDLLIDLGATLKSGDLPDFDVGGHA